jgi:hypothetical protein
VAYMKHASTRTVYDYWNRKRAGRAAPDRNDINPVEIRHALSDTFMLAADFVDQLRFRLAGTRVCALFGREIKGEVFAELWGDRSRKIMEEQLSALTCEGAGAVAGVTARTEDGTATDLELLLLPLAHTGHARIRAIGVLAPVVPPYWLGAQPVAELALGTVRHVAGDAERHPAPRFMPGIDSIRLKHGFVVYSGGRENPPGERAS